MNKFDQISLKYITYALLPVIILFVWCGIEDPSVVSDSKGMERFLWDSLGWIFMIWTLLLLCLVLKMVFVKSLRESVLKRIAQIRTRDEREELISGEAVKVSLLSTLAVMIFILFTSLVHVKVGKYPEGTRGDDKHGFITLGMSFAPTLETAPTKEVKNDGLEIFSYSGLPLSGSFIVILLFLWQLGSYQIVVRRLNREEA
jgi:Na+/H+-dicarboxylate symporter